MYCGAIIEILPSSGTRTSTVFDKKMSSPSETRIRTLRVYSPGEFGWKTIEMYVGLEL